MFIDIKRTPLKQLYIYIYIMIVIHECKCFYNLKNNHVNRYYKKLVNRYMDQISSEY